MASTYSPSLKITLMGDGDQAGLWGQTTNTNLGTLVEQAITGVQNITMVDANYTLTNFNGITNEARNAVLVVTGTNTAVRDLIPPVVEKLYTIVNNTTGGFAIRVIGGSGTGVNIPNGATCLVYCDGTNFVNGLSGAAGNFTVSGALAVTGTTVLTGATTITGALGGSTATFSGAISSVSPTFTGTPLAPTATAGTNTTQIATTAFVLSNGTPTGGLIMWGTGSAPSGWLLCNGTAVSRSTYSALFAVIGTTFGVGDSSTTFNLPNYTNRMPYGTTVGATGGSADAVVVSHNHSATSAVSDPTHLHASTGNGAPNGVGAGVAMTGEADGGFNTTSASTGITVATTIATAGVSGTNANLPPYLGINFIIKT